jgi:hypothetical protein
MATKDWEKTGEYQWVKKNDVLEIIKNYDKNGNIKFYSVEIFLWETEDEVAKWLNSRRFSSEKRAIKEAKQYMRTH